MLKKAAAMLLACASMAMCVGCSSSTSSRFLYAALPTANQIVAYREDPNSGVLTLLSISPITAGPAVESLAIHPSKKFMYAANSFESDISLYTLASSGALTEVTPRTPTGTTPTLLVMDTTGSFLYVANSGSANISVFSIDAGSGALTAVTGSPFPVGPSPLSMRLTPSGNFLYVSSSGAPGNVEVWSSNAGVLSIAGVAQVGTNPNGMVIDSSGAHLYVANSNPDNSISEFSINSTTGLLTLLSTISGPALSSPVDLLIDKSGKYLYAANEASSNLAAYSVASDGSLGLLGNSPFATNTHPSVIASDSSGKYLFVANQSTPAIQSFSLDGSTGTLTPVASYTLGNAATSIVVTQ
jgi:6-phosphogluconolactonase